MSRLLLLTLCIVLLPAKPAAAQPNPLSPNAMLWLQHAQNGQTVNCAVLSPDGTILAAPVGTKLTAWDTKTGKPLWNATLCEPIGPRSVAFSPDGKMLAACGDFGVMRFFDPRTGKEPMTAMPLEGRHDWWIVAYSPDGKHLVTACVRGILGFWDVNTGKQLSQVKCRPANTIMDLHFSADSKKFAVSCRGSTQVDYWDPVAAKETGFIKPDPRGVEKAMFTADGKAIVYASPNTDSSITLWDFAAAREIRKFGGPRNGWIMESFTLSPGGHTMVASKVNDPGVYLFETATGEERGRFVGHNGRFWAMSFDRSGRSLVTGATDGTTIIWDMTGAWSDGKYRPEKLKPEGLANAWHELALLQGGVSPYRNVWKLAMSPEETVPFLRTRFNPDKPAKLPADLAKKVGLLDDDDFRVREKAFADLKATLPASEGALRGTLSGNLSNEAKGRILSMLPPPAKDPATLSRIHVIRALEALEMCGTPAARELFDDLAKGHREAWIAEEARAVLVRWRE